MGTAQASGVLAPVAELFGELLLIELTPGRLLQLREPEIVATLAAVGISLPEEGELDEVAADFFDRFVNPQKGFPLVESLYREGSFEGAAAVSIRKVAEAAGLEFEAQDARGAAVDHVGSELILWARLVRRDAAAAAEFAAQHLAWAPSILRRSAGTSSDGVAGASFLRDVALATAELIEQILSATDA